MLEKLKRAEHVDVGLIATQQEVLDVRVLRFLGCSAAQARTPKIVKGFRPLWGSGATPHPFTTPGLQMLANVLGNLGIPGAAE